MEELDLKEIFNLFWNKKLQIILIIALFVIIGVVYTLGFVKPVYKSSTTLVLGKVENSKNESENDSITTSDITLNSKLLATYSELVKSKKVLRTVISNLGVKVNESDLRNNITVSSVKNTELIEITVTNKDPVVASRIANETAKVFIANVTEMYNISNVHIVDEAEVASSPSNIHRVRDVIIFGVGGLVIAVIYVLLLNMLDTTVKSDEDIEKLLEIPVLASVPLYDFEDSYDKGGKRR